MRVAIEAVDGVPLVKPGDDLAAVVLGALEASGLTLANQDVIVVAQKIVSKAEGRLVDLATVAPSPRAVELGRATDKDPRLIEVILSESVEVVRHKPGVIVVEHKLGFVMANAGVDRSNVSADGMKEPVLLLPADPDRSAVALKAALDKAFAADVGVVISDSVGRAWRNGTVGLALGAAGLPALDDRRGRPDLFGRKLEVTEVALADQIAAAAAIAMGEGDEGRPLVLVRGVSWTAPARPAKDLIRPKAMDLFR